MSLLLINILGRNMVKKTPSRCIKNGGQSTCTYQFNGQSTSRGIVWSSFCNIHKTNNLSNVVFICRKNFTCKIQRGDELLTYINNIEALVDQLACLEVSVRNKRVAMTLLKNMLPSYEHRIIALEVMLIKDLTMEYMTLHLMHKMSKR